MNDRMRRSAGHAFAFLADERGSVLPIVGLCMLAILGVAALAIDIGYQQTLQTQLEATADAAALAAANQLPNKKKALEAAEKYAELNMPHDQHGYVLHRNDVIFGTWHADSRTFLPGGKDPNAVRVTVQRSEENGNPAETFFLQIFGTQASDLQAQALAGLLVALPDPGSDPTTWTPAERDQVSRIKVAIEEENKRRMWDKVKRRYDRRKAMSPQETQDFIEETFGRAVLLL
ncbi:MAG TPA: TadG family pilus assembly protein [Dongiaceae bacterium]|jgi:Flp pilus assembly protein TadG